MNQPLATLSPSSRGSRVKGALHVAGMTGVAALMFLVVTPFAVWVLGDLHLKTADGSVVCYVAALPFFRNALAGDTLYVAVLFGSLGWAEFQCPCIRLVVA